jgi:lipoprotein-releasing system permease protein
VNFSFFIARRYLFSKKSTNVINVISGISVIGVLVGTAALVILLSAFNGLESWVVKLYNSFDPDIKIERVDHKRFTTQEFPFDKLKSLQEVAYVLPVLEENGMLTYNEAQFICTIKGVAPQFVRMSGIDSMLSSGNFSLNDNNQPAALLGRGIAYALSFNLKNMNTKVDLYVPQPNADFSTNPAEAFKTGSININGIFEIQPEFDTKYIIVPIDFAQELFNLPGNFNSVELQFKPSTKNKENLQQTIQSLVGSNYVVKNRFQQHELLYKIINSEKWAVYLILSFILFIAIFNITGSLTMLIVDKSSDIATLKALGANTKTIKQIFFLEGLLISMLGLIIGLFAGVIIVQAQDIFQFVLINDVDPYPVVLKTLDLVYISATVLAIGAFAAWFPANRLLKHKIK